MKKLKKALMLTAGVMLGGIIGKGTTPTQEPPPKKIPIQDSMDAQIDATLLPKLEDLKSSGRILGEFEALNFERNIAGRRTVSAILSAFVAGVGISGALCTATFTTLIVLGFAFISSGVLVSPVFLASAIFVFACFLIAAPVGVVSGILFDKYYNSPSFFNKTVKAAINKLYSSPLYSNHKSMTDDALLKIANDTFAEDAKYSLLFLYVQQTRLRDILNATIKSGKVTDPETLGIVSSMRDRIGKVVKQISRMSEFRSQYEEHRNFVLKQNIIHKK